MTRIYVDMDGVLVNFQSGINKLSKEELVKYKGHYDDCPGIFSKMDPIPDSIKSFKKLSKEHDVYILSTAAWDNSTCWSDKLLWVQKYLEPSAHKRLILSHRKDLLNGDILIDDRTVHGAAEFKGTFIQFGTEKFPDWPSVLKYIDGNVGRIGRSLLSDLFNNKLD
jgi:5'-nucleotidase